MKNTLNNVTLFLVGLFLSVATLNAAETVITGDAPDYAGTTLKLSAFDNLISRTESVIAECTVAADGHFRLSFTVEQTQTAMFHLGIFNGRITVEPGVAYTVTLPQRVDKTPEEAASPFFEEVHVSIQVKSAQRADNSEIAPSKELNRCLLLFDDEYNTVYDSIARMTALKRPFKTESFIDSLANRFPDGDDNYLNSYKRYRYGLLYYVAQKSIRFISKKYFDNQPVLCANEAYMELFQATYKNYFMYFGRTAEGHAIYDAINERHSLTELKQLLKSEGTFDSEELTEFIILKNLYDEFYASRFSRTALLKIIDDLAQTTTNKQFRVIAHQLRNKMTHLQSGYDPPPFTLCKQDSTLVSLSDYRGKYVYLMFCSTQNYACFNQYRYLKELYAIHRGWLNIVLVSADDSFAHMREFRKKNDYGWDFLHIAHQPSILLDYDIRVFPTCFFISPDGKLIASPAPKADQLEDFLYKELNNKNLWREYIKKGLIDGKRLNEFLSPEGQEKLFLRN